VSGTCLTRTTRRRRRDSRLSTGGFTRAKRYQMRGRAAKEAGSASLAMRRCGSIARVPAPRQD